MHLKTLQLTGFKTFADKTEIQFSKGVTAIVGPNGSGKSNIADALLWALGEQKASAMRGAKAQDIIFNGSVRRKKVGLAEVTLTVDNADGSLPLAFEEVTITRRAYRTGDSDYFINKTACRMKDIYELFLDTGVGRDAYALVNQSSIDAVLTADPEVRRGLFEEAAGIKKYRVKKREALKKLEATEANLTRVRDILSEISHTIDPLRVQAEVATKYNSLREQLTNIERDFLITELRTADRERSLARDIRVAQEEKSRYLADRLSTLHAESASLFEQQSAAEEALSRIRRANQQALSAHERSISEQRLASQQAQSLTARIELHKQEIAEIEETRVNGETRAATLSSEATAARSAEQELRQSLNAEDLDGKNISERMIGLQRRIEQRRIELTALSRRQSAAQAELVRSESRAAESGTLLPALQDESAELVRRLSELAELVEQSASRMDAAKSRLDVAEEQVRLRETGIQDARAKAREAQLAADAARGESVSLAARVRSLEELEDSREGYFQGVRAVVQAAKRREIAADLTVVVEAFTAPSGLETAFEVALGGSLQDIITGTEVEAKRGIEYLKETRSGRATFLPLDRMRPQRDGVSIGTVSGVLGPAMSLITFEERFRPALQTLLGGALVCETLDDALRASDSAQNWNRIVTLAGEIVLPTGAMTGGASQRKGTSLLSRKADLADLRKRVAIQQRTEAASTDMLTASRAAQDAAEQALSAARAEVQEARAALGSVRQTVEHTGRERSQIRERQDVCARRIENLTAAALTLRETIEANAVALAKLGDDNAACEEAMARDRDELDTLRAERELKQAGLNQERVALAGLSEKASGLERAARAAREDSEALASRIRHRRTQCDEALRELGTLEANTALRDLACRECEAMVKGTTSDLEAAQAACTDFGRRAQVAAASIRQVTSAREESVDLTRKNELREQRFEMQVSQASARLLDEYEVTADYALSLASDPTAPADTPRDVGRLRRELRAMGDVNTGAAEEYTRLCERETFLNEQKADAEGARERLLAAIHEIDAGTRDVFMDSFNAVAAAFEEIFQRLFSGGATELILTTPDDLLETGVEIRVQPPGKKKQSLGLLSGGERALTAAALLFAFLKVKPAPFCVLDEVDAPLDGVNVERFADLLRDFGTSTQFLVITHNPSTMEAAPIWYGVTMQEPGISRVISLQVPQIAE